MSHDPEALADWLESAALRLGIEAQPAESSYPEFEKQLCHIGPALLYVLAIQGPTLLATLDNSTFLTPDLRKAHVAPLDVRSELCAAIEGQIVTQIQEMLDRAGCEFRAISCSPSHPARKARG
jgi:hypothetical protein